MCMLFYGDEMLNNWLFNATKLSLYDIYMLF